MEFDVEIVRVAALALMGISSYRQACEQYVRRDVL
jgi:hypothetical protein